MKGFLLLLLAAGWLHSRPLAAQTRPADSLRALLREHPQADTLRARRLQALGWELAMTDLPQAIGLLQQELALSRRIGDAHGEGQALIGLGTMLRLQANFALARRYTQEAQALFIRRRDRGRLAMAYLQYSLIEKEEGSLPAAVHDALRGLRYAEQARARTTQTQLQVTLASIYIDLGNYRDALQLLHHMLKDATALGDQYVAATTLSLLGNTYQQLSDWPHALAYYQRAEVLNRKLGDLRSVTTDEISLAELYLQRGDYSRALQYGQQARAMALAEKDSYNLPAAELALARTYLLTKHPDSALVLARRGFDQSQHSVKENLRNGSEILALAYAQLGNFPQAYRYQELATAYKDSLSGQEIQRRTNALRYGYELDRKQAQIALLTKGRQLQAQKAARQRQGLRGLLAGLLGVLVLAALLARNIYIKQRTNRALKEKKAQIAQQRDDLNSTLHELQTTQRQLVQNEKMVALAALMGGVAHEIQNPLNFVNNFSEVSLELVTELEELQQEAPRNDASEAELLDDLKQNLTKIHQHGARAGAIVTGMLAHSSSNTGQRQPADLNALARDYLRLAAHGAHGKAPNLTVAQRLALAADLPPLLLVPQEIGKVLLNLYANAFYAVQQKAALLGPAYAPEILVSTRRWGSGVELRVRDNGTGISTAVVEKIFDPFFTTKSAGEGTGLGLSLSYDIVTKGYGGTLGVETREGEFTALVMTLPAGHPAPAPRPPSRPELPTEHGQTGPW